MNMRLIQHTGTAGLMLLLAAAPTGAQENAPPKDATDAPSKLSLSAASNPAKRAKWQERLTLGAGDVLDFS